jgi:hypothetical protein
MLNSTVTAMFVRSVKTRGRKGEKHEYLRLVESYRDSGRYKQRVVLNLGRKDILAPHLDGLVRLLQGEGTGNRWVPEWEEHGRVQVNLSWPQPGPGSSQGFGHQPSAITRSNTEHLM